MKVGLLILGQTAETAQTTTAAQRMAAVKTIAADLGKPQVRLADSGPVYGETIAELGISAGASVPTDTTIFIIGAPTNRELLQVHEDLRAFGYKTICVYDALENVDSLRDAVDTLSDDEHNYQFVVSGAVKSIMKTDFPFQYAYPMADSTATIVIFFDDCTNVLVIRRKHPPFQGEEALPGGYLRVGFETLRQCARRETTEETSVVFDEEQILPVDERSSPTRDPRGHVIDHGYAVVVPAELREQVVASIAAGDDADQARIAPVSELLSQGLAFDHRDLLITALKTVGASLPV